MSITVEEVQMKKINLRHDISSLIKKFEEETNTEISEMKISRVPKAVTQPEEPFYFEVIVNI